MDTKDQILPLRAVGLEMRTLGDEAVAVHAGTASVLQPQAAALLERCDGTTTVAEAALALGCDEVAIEALLGDLEAAGLVTPKPGHSRRAVMLGAAAAVVAGAVVSLPLPAAAEATSSGGGAGDPECLPMESDLDNAFCYTDPCPEGAGVEWHFIATSVPLGAGLGQLTATFRSSLDGKDYEFPDPDGASYPGKEDAKEKTTQHFYVTTPNDLGRLTLISVDVDFPNLTDAQDRAVNLRLSHISCIINGVKGREMDIPV